MYNIVMTAKSKKTTSKKKRSKPGRVRQIHASIEDELLNLAEESAQSRWNRPRKRRVSLRIDTEVVEWFQSRGPGYQTRINRILRRVMLEGKKRDGKR